MRLSASACERLGELGATLKHPPGPEASSPNTTSFALSKRVSEAPETPQTSILCGPGDTRTPSTRVPLKPNMSINAFDALKMLILNDNFAIQAPRCFSEMA